MNLEAKFDLYLREFKKHQDPDGFILTDKCDSLLFSCLVGCVQGVDVKVHAAYHVKNGTWHRRPLRLSDGRTMMYGSGYPECYECGGSKSTISRDMLLGLAWYAWCNKRQDIAEGVVKYALKNFGVMGKGLLSRTFIGPGLLSTFAWISYKLGGPSRLWLRIIPADPGVTSGIVDYQAHLQVLHCHLRSEVTGRKADRVRASRVAARHSTRVGSVNAYFNYVESFEHPVFSQGAMNKLDALLLLDQPHFPNDRLPDTENYPCEWIWERDPIDWQPDGRDLKQHTGGDFLWAAAWYLGKIKGVKQ